MNDRATAIRELQARIADLKQRLPKHSTPPAMLLELEEMEEALQQLLDQQPDAGAGETSGAAREGAGG